MADKELDELTRLLALPWSLQIHRDTDGSFVAEIGELPEFIAAADDENTIDAAVWDSLRSLLSSYVAAGDRVPVPVAAASQIQPSIGTYQRNWVNDPRAVTPPAIGSDLIGA